ncbi:MAG: phosphate acyltransferase [Bacteroidales bacterium]|nr:phosphate acyltransferase [Bacteroidales bacterium]
MRIGLDILGGDFAPEATVKGALLAAEELKENETLVLIGPKDKVIEIIGGESKVPIQFDFIDLEEGIPMGAHPYKSYVGMPKATIPVGFQLLREKKIDVFASAGNTGAMMVGASTVIKTVEGIIRPAIAGILPKPNGKLSIILDVGLNPDSKPDVLLQYGVIGSLYAKYVFGVENPEVGLLNIGEEPSKGNLVAKAAYELLGDNKQIKFRGNIEGNEFFQNSMPEVIVTDGFVGNIVLKQAEAFYMVLKQAKLDNPFVERFNYENIGGSPILGLKANVLIAHGKSSPIAIKNLVLQSRPMVEANLASKFKKIFDDIPN